MPQRIGFLDLPREIRDQIYNYLLISPTNLIEVIYPPPSTPTPTTRFLKRPQQSRFTIAPAYPNTSLPPPSDYTLPSLSICRTNVQIHHETQHIFHSHNVLYSSQPFRNTKYRPNITRTLKLMGQTSSRLLTTLIISMPLLDLSYKQMSKLMPALNSRARHGAFKTLELRWEGKAWDDLYFVCQMWLDFSIGYRYETWNILLQALGHARTLRRFEGRIVVVPKEGGDKEKLARIVKYIAEELNSRFRGKLLVGDVLSWEDSVQVNETYLDLFLGEKA